MKTVSLCVRMQFPDSVPTSMVRHELHRAMARIGGVEKVSISTLPRHIPIMRADFSNTALGIRANLMSDEVSRIFTGRDLYQNNECGGFRAQDALTVLTQRHAPPGMREDEALLALFKTPISASADPVDTDTLGVRA